MTRFARQGSGLYTPPPALEGELILCTGQSNTWGPNPGLAGVTSGVLYWDSDLTPPINAGNVVSTFWHSAHGTSFHPSHGCDRSMIAQLLAAPGYNGRTAVMCVAVGSTTSDDWLPATTRYANVKTAIQLAISLLPSAFPAVTSWACRQVRNQGQSDMRVNSLPFQQQWAANTTTWTNALKTQIVAPAFADVPHRWKPDLVVQCNPLISGAYFVGTGVIPQQYIYIGESPGSAPHMIVIPGGPTGYYEMDEVHFTTPGNLAGGTMIGDQVVYLDANGM